MLLFLCTSLPSFLLLPSSPLSLIFKHDDENRYILANIGLALTHVYWLLVVLRCVQAAGSASVIALGAGSIGDISSPKERGLYMAVFSLGPMVSFAF